MMPKHKDTLDTWFDQQFYNFELYQYISIDGCFGTWFSCLPLSLVSGVFCLTLVVFADEFGVCSWTAGREANI